MYIPLAAIAFLTSAFSFAGAKSHLEDLNEGGPWRIKRLNFFSAAPGKLGSSTISFDFQDPTTKVSTHCNRTVETTQGYSVVDPYHYYSCKNESVAYKFYGEQ